MIARNTILTLMVALAASAGAQTVGSAVDPLEFPVEGVLTGAGVYIRSQALPEAYTCGKISRPVTVTVAGRDGDWLKIVPPEGVFSVIDKSYVRRDAESWGTVTGEKVRIRAGSSPLLADANAHHVVQGYLNTGHTVEIIGEGGDFYKIVPPGGAYVWISARYVRLPGQEAVEPPPSGDAVVDMAEGDALDAGEPADAAMAEAGRQFLAADDMLIAESQKPKLEQNLRGVLAAYHAIDVPAGSVMRGAVDRRIAYVESAIELQDDAVEVEDMAARAHRRQAELERRLARGGSGLPDAGPAATYDAWGVVSACAVYPGGATGKRFLLRDPDTNDATAYARDRGGQAGLAQYEGRLVGVQGRVTYESQTGMNIVDVTRVTPLAPVEPPPARTPEPPRPAEPPAAELAPPPSEPARTDVPAVVPVRDPISLEPDELLDTLPPSPPAEPDVPAPPAAEIDIPAPPAEPDAPAIPDEPVRPSRLIHPEPGSEDASEIPQPPDRPPRPSIDGPPARPSDAGPPRPIPPPSTEDAGAPEPPADEEENEPPARPAVEIRRPLPPPGLPIEDEPSEDGPAIDTREYE